MKERKQMIKRTIGLDAHPDSFTAGVLVGCHPEEATVEKVSDSIPLDRLEDWFKRHASREATVVLEASGNSFAIYERLTAIGFHVLVLDSEQVGKIGKSYCNTDKISAVRIARAFLTGLSDEVWVPDPVTRQRREVFGSYQQAVTDCTRCNNRIKSMLNEHTIRLKKGEKKLINPKVRERVFKAKEWEGSQLVLREEAFSDLDRANQKRDRLRRVMVSEIIKEPIMLQLVRIFGVSKIAAYGLIAMIGEPHRFATPKRLTAYFGLNPRIKSSGNTTKLGPISKRGRRDIRTLLVQAAHAVLRNRSGANPLYSWAWRMNFRKGTKIAAVAVARKISVAVWYLLMGKPFKAKEKTETLIRKLRGLAKDLGRQQVKDLGFATYNDFIQKHLLSMEEFACRGGHT